MHAVGRVGYWARSMEGSVFSTKLRRGFFTSANTLLPTTFFFQRFSCTYILVDYTPISTRKQNNTSYIHGLLGVLLQCQGR